MSKLEKLATAVDRSGVLRGSSWLRSGRNARHLGAFGYHRVAERSPDEPWSDEIIDATPAELRKQLERIRTYGRCASLEDVRSLSRGERLRGTPVLLTFDDGYRSCVDVALPLLQEFGMHATFFISTAYIDERRLFWWDRLAYLLKRSGAPRLELGSPWSLSVDLEDRGRATAELATVFEHRKALDRGALLDAIAEALGVPWGRDLERRFADELLLNWSGVEQLLAAGMDVQSHTVSHHILQTLDPAELEFELVHSRARLEERLGIEVDTIAYPSGFPIHGDSAIVEAVRDAGYNLGFSCGGGASRTTRFDPFNVKRMTVDTQASSSMRTLETAWPSFSYEGARAVGYLPR